MTFHITLMSRMRGDNSSAMFNPFPFPGMLIILVEGIILIIRIIAGRNISILFSAKACEPVRVLSG